MGYDVTPSLGLRGSDSDGRLGSQNLGKDLFGVFVGVCLVFEHVFGSCLVCLFLFCRNVMCDLEKTGWVVMFGSCGRFFLMGNKMNQLFGSKLPNIRP